jgi:hypothetical protein
MRKKRLLLVLGVLLLLIYGGSYIILSRQGYTHADQYKMKGFYYFTPEDTDSWRIWNYACVYVYWPLNVLDRWIGLGRYPASEPLWRLTILLEPLRCVSAGPTA